MKTTMTETNLTVHPPTSPSDSNSDSDRSDDYQLPLTSPIRIHHQHPNETDQDEQHTHTSSEADAERGQLLSSWKSQQSNSNSNLNWSEDEEEEDDEDDSLEDEGEEGDDEDDKSIEISKCIKSYKSTSNQTPHLTIIPNPNLQILSNSSFDSDLQSPDISLDSTRLSDERRRKLKRRKKRRVYGGGRLDAGGELEIWEVALGIAGDILSPAPLFIPHAFLLLGLPIGLPVLFLSAFLAWFSHVVLVVCGRYVGGRTYAQIASAVFPDRCKGFNLWFGESVVELSRLFIAGGRGMVNMMMVSDLFAQLTRQYTPKAAILYSRVFIIVFVALISLIPNFIRPRRPIFMPAAFPTLSRLPLLLTTLWPIALGLIGFRLRQLNKELGRKLPPSGEGDVYSEIMGGTVWGGFTIILFCLTTPQNTFTHLRSLKRINKLPAQPAHHPMVPIGHGATPDPTLNRGSFATSYTLRRYSWESASFLGVLYACLICLGWGLVGYLGMDHGGYEVNFLASLPSADPWISASRVLILIVLIPSIPLSLRAATTSLFHFCRIPFVIRTASSRRARLRNRGNSSKSGERRRGIDTEWDDEDEDEELKGIKVWGARLVTMIVWVGVSIGAVLWGGSNGGEGSTIEMLGCVGSTFMTGILPAIFFVVLFHVRKARSIFVTDSRTQQDELLVRKESQLQRRLNGRRLWQDVCVFGILLPYCMVILMKGLIAAFTLTRIDGKP
ncbi:uncharacterized protein MELLADRAFT_116329 [Melampsora larici-populina 98AG31]|uniref:Amino acid transporter transmembrane domain-containing protein n=1 Tax=Melampsora larici-populina (strain 98AG31 / pathotype 3-4-7) TaxID=747676 RepID=F4RK27_MELLP|nr:uncharacterized protein MELLADRAFT_116329 [Melampsora larici-populina 98AG31]EGG07260.1 hypothetical protein MELLADRAFT_116329 [Melampsora larici-populina 98AG31]